MATTKPKGRIAAAADRLMKKARNQYGGSRDRVIESQERAATQTSRPKKKK